MKPLLLKSVNRCLLAAMLCVFAAPMFAQTAPPPSPSQSQLSPLQSAATATPVAPASVTATPAAVNNQDYRLGAGDAIGVQVYQSPDLSIDARVSESGVISYPLVGSVQL